MTPSYFLILVLNLTAINDEERRDTQLVLSHMTKKEPFSLISSFSSGTKLMRRFISGTGDEVIVNDNVLMLLISYENGTYQNLPLSCLPFELYDQVDLDPSIAMIITCYGDSTVYVLKNNTNGYSVSEHISPPDSKQYSSSAIVIKNGQSTAIYIGPSNFLFYYGLGINGIPLPFNLISSPCADWHVSSSSDEKVALHCKTSNKVFLATGSDGSVVDVTSSVNNPDSLKHIHNERMAIEITSTGATIYQNDFFDIHPIAIPSPMVERVSYAYVDGFLCFLFFSSSSIYLLNTSKPLVDESLEQIVTDEDTLIEYNSSYIFISPSFNSLSYVVEDSGFWTVKTIDIVTRQYYPSVTQPWIPLMLDMRVQVSAITTSTTTTSTSSSETAIVESTAITPTTTDSTSGSVTVTTTQATSTLIPVDGTAVLSVRNIIIIVIVIVFVATILVLLLSLIAYCFHSSNSKSAEESSSSDIETQGTISNHSSYPQLAQQETDQRQETDGFIIQQEVDSANGREEQVPGHPGLTLTQIYYDQRTPN